LRHDDHRRGDDSHGQQHRTHPHPPRDG
jgi:hypothetical protein